MRVEEEYERQGALAYLAAWDVRRAKIFQILGEPLERCVDLALSHKEGLRFFENLFCVPHPRGAAVEFQLRHRSDYNPITEPLPPRAI